MTVLSYYNLFFKAVSNKTRLEILNLLKEGPKNVTEMCEKLDFEQSRVSHALTCLTNCGFVSSSWKSGKKIYSLNGNLIPIINEIDNHISKFGKELVRCKILKEDKNGKI